MSPNRRQFIAGAGAVLGATALGTTAFGDTSVSVRIEGVDPEKEVVTLENTGEEAVDLSGYVVDWEHNGDQNQTDEIPDGTSIDPGQQLRLWSGYRQSNAEYDVQLGDYGTGRINNNDPDVIALLSPEGEVVATSDDVDDGGSGGSGGGNGGSADPEPPADDGSDDDSDDGSETPTDDGDDGDDEC